MFVHRYGVCLARRFTQTDKYIKKSEEDDDLNRYLEVNDTFTSWTEDTAS